MDQSSYFDLSQPDDPRERTAYFVLDSLLKSRIECGFESSATEYEETVNVYLVHLLSGLVQAPDLGAFPSDSDIEVFERVRESTDSRFKREVYRINADHLLLATGIFTETPYVEREGQRVFEDTARLRIGRGKAYYHYAAQLHGRVRAGSPVFSSVLHQLSEDFERYVAVLFHMRGEYFNLYDRLGHDQLLSFTKDVAPVGAQQESTEKLRDEFLDAYWLWHQTPTDASRLALQEAVKRLQAADSTFEFDLPEQ